MIFIFLILLSQNILAWNSYNHHLIVETIYYNLDFNTQQELNITAMKIGSVAPDRVFHDNRLHHYPPSYNLAVNWLKAAEENYSLGNYDEASYSFGVASHYISDSFVAPHYIAKEPSSLHSKFENIRYKPKTKCFSSNYNLNQSLYLASKNEADWGEWLISKNSSIPEKELEQSLTLLFPIALEVFNTSCNDLETEIIKKKFNPLNRNVIIYIILLITALLLYLSYKGIFSKTK